MPEPADAQDGDEIAGLRAAVAQRVEGGDARAEQRAGVDSRPALISRRANGSVSASARVASRKARLARLFGEMKSAVREVMVRFSSAAATRSTS